MSEVEPTPTPFDPKHAFLPTLQNISMESDGWNRISLGKRQAVLYSLMDNALSVLQSAPDISIQQLANFVHYPIIQLKAVRIFEKNPSVAAVTHPEDGHYVFHEHGTEDEDLFIRIIKKGYMRGLEPELHIPPSYMSVAVHDPIQAIGTAVKLSTATRMWMQFPDPDPTLLRAYADAFHSQYLHMIHTLYPSYAFIRKQQSIMDSYPEGIQTLPPSILNLHHQLTSKISNLKNN